MIYKQGSEPSRFDIEPHVGRSIADVERNLIIATLARCGGNRTWAADILGICTRTLRNKLVAYDSTPVPSNKGDRKSGAEEENWLTRLERYEPGGSLPS